MNNKLSLQKQEMCIKLDRVGVTLQQAEKAFKKVRSLRNIQKRQPDMTPLTDVVNALNGQIKDLLKEGC